MATRTRYAPDRGLTVRMTATMFFLGLVFVAFVAYDEGMKPAEHPVVVSLTPEQFAAAAQGEISLREAIPVAQGIRKVRVIVLDAALGAVGSVTIPMQQASR